MTTTTTRATSALDALLATYRQEKARRDAEQAREAAAHEAEERRRQARQLEELYREGREYLGPVFDELAGEGKSGFWGPSIPLNPGPGPTFLELKGRNPTAINSKTALILTVGRNHFRLELPADEMEIAEIISRAIESRERSRRRAIRYAIQAIQSPEGGDDDPATEFNRLVETWPDAADEVRPVLGERLAQDRQREQATADAIKRAADAWYPFTVWKLTYVTYVDGALDEGEDPIYTEVAYSIAPEPDSDGWWPTVSRGKRGLTRFPTLLRVDEINLTDGDNAHAWAVCAFEYQHGVRILTPPPGAIRLDQSLIPE